MDAIRYVRMEKYTCKSCDGDGIFVSMGIRKDGVRIVMAQLNAKPTQINIIRAAETYGAVDWMASARAAVTIQI